MDPALLTHPGFWADPGNWSAEFIPPVPDLAGHVFFQTSGSSGEPKWIALSKDALLISAAAVNRHLEVSGASRWGLALPAHHVGGFGVAARAFEAACDLEVFPGRWNPLVFKDWLVEKRVTHTALVPTQVHDLVAAGLRSPPDLAAIVVGGGRLDDTTGQRARDLGWPVLASYGMTEAGSQIATQSPASLTEPFSPDRIPVLSIWQTEISPDGRLKIAGPALFTGTLLKNGADWNFIRREGDWHVTSDRAALENDLLTPLGRADMLVKVLGELVDPESIEREISSLSGGALPLGSFVIIARPDERAGHRLVPVFADTGDRGLITDALARYHCSAPGFRRLKAPVFIPRIPRSPLGKPLRSEIKLP